MGEVTCIECKRLPVKSRPNTRCLTCGATVCRRCQESHFERVHESSDEDSLRSQGVI
jgi:hypothetical protein